MTDRESMVVLERLIQIIGVSFAYIYLVARLIGQENKNTWFKKRTRSSFFTRRGFIPKPGSRKNPFLPFTIRYEFTIKGPLGNVYISIFFSFI